MWKESYESKNSMFLSFKFLLLNWGVFALWENLWVWIENQFLSKKSLFQMGWFIVFFILISYCSHIQLIGIKPKILLVWTQEEVEIKA